jgi:hypothetical protein
MIAVEFEITRLAQVELEPALSDYSVKLSVAENASWLMTRASHRVTGSHWRLSLCYTDVIPTSTKVPLQSMTGYTKRSLGHHDGALELPNDQYVMPGWYCAEDMGTLEIQPVPSECDADLIPLHHVHHELRIQQGSTATAASSAYLAVTRS